MRAVSHMRRCAASLTLSSISCSWAGIAVQNPVVGSVLLGDVGHMPGIPALQADIIQATIALCASSVAG